MKILVTGSDGQLGQTFKYNISKNYKYYFANKNDLNLLNIETISNFLDRINPNIIINCAAYTSVDEAERERELAFAINHHAVKAISQWAYINKSFLIHFSTDYVFDGKEEFYYENDITNPLSVYGKSKLYGENSFLDSNAKGICIRTSWVHSNYGKNFFLTMKNLFLNNKTIKVINDQKGIPTTTDFLVKKTHQLIYLYSKEIELPKMLHVCPCGYTTWYDFALFIYKNLKKDKSLKLRCKNIEHVNSENFPQIAKRPKSSILSNKKLMELIKSKLNNWSDEHTKLYKGL